MVNKEAEDDCLWFCGEAYAKEKRWVNSALQSSLQVCCSITRYFNFNQSGGGKSKKTMKRRKDGKSGRKDGKGRKNGARKDGKEWTMREIKTANREKDFI